MLRRNLVIKKYCRIPLCSHFFFCLLFFSPLSWSNRWEFCCEVTFVILSFYLNRSTVIYVVLFLVFLVHKMQEFLLAVLTIPPLHVLCQNKSTFMIKKIQIGLLHSFTTLDVLLTIVSGHFFRQTTCKKRIINMEIE